MAMEVSLKPTKPDGRGKNPNSLKNLRPFPPGENGVKNNPAGYSLKSRLKQCIAKPLAKPDADAPAGDLLVYSTLKNAIDCVPVAFREAWDRAEGRVPGDNPPTNQDNRVTNFVFILPDGTQVSPAALSEVKKLANRNLP